MRDILFFWNFYIEVFTKKLTRWSYTVFYANSPPFPTAKPAALHLVSIEIHFKHWQPFFCCWNEYQFIHSLWIALYLCWVALDLQCYMFVCAASRKPSKPKCPQHHPYRSLFFIDRKNTQAIIIKLTTPMRHRHQTATFYSTSMRHLLSILQRQTRKYRLYSTNLLRTSHSSHGQSSDIVAFNTKKCKPPPTHRTGKFTFHQ